MLTRDEYLNLMTSHIIAMGGFDENETAEAKDYVGELLEDFLEWNGIDYGDPEYNWDKDSAHEMIDVEMSYWEYD